ncbi:MAG: aminoacetone oxidase family FAD-binding enzyme [Gloeobacteraceae cyanobacterium ES-bin-144]|nr:aminoacetone oxidase family FAD-binding enzyme [Verrucomicrobiales bacterium]
MSVESDREPLDLAVIGGGASGFFTALQYAEMAPGKSVSIFEKGGHFLQKVRISGGGRCNVTHSCFEPKLLAGNYPRGSRELLGAFHRWQPSDTVAWFARYGVHLKTEPDGRMFPVTDRSETVIQCFLERAREFGIPLYQKHSLIGIEKLDGGGFSLVFENIAETVNARSVCIATGSLKDSALLRELKKLQQPIAPLVPSLFAFNVTDARLSGLAGVSHPKISIHREGSRLAQHGPLLITHRGLSGPAVLRLSAWEARALAESNHHFKFIIDWLPHLSMEDLKNRFAQIRQQQGAKLVSNTPIAPIPRRLWEGIVIACEIEDHTTWGQLSRFPMFRLLEELKSARFEATGKTTNKDEFVTCGGIERQNIDFRTMESRSVPGLFFTGECIDIDGITGGFNFQAAWTTAHIAAIAIATR